MDHAARAADVFRSRMGQRRHGHSGYKEGGREGGRVGGREGGREGGWEGGREGGREEDEMSGCQFAIISRRQKSKETSQ